MQGKRTGRLPTRFLSLSLCAMLLSLVASELYALGRAGPGILAVIEDVREIDGNSCPMELTVRRFVLGNPADYLGERISVCAVEGASFFTLHFGSRAELDSSDFKRGDLIRFWPEEAMRPSDPISMTAKSLELLEKSG